MKVTPALLEMASVFLFFGLLFVAGVMF